MSIVDQILGRGAVAEFCLWKNKIISGIVLVMATISWCVLEIMETPLVQFLCSIWLLLMLLLFIWVKFGQLLFTRRPPTPEEIRKRGTPVRALFLRTERLFLRLYVIAYGEDIKNSLWAIIYVAILHTIGSHINLLTILYICLVSSMTIPVLYLKNQVVVDNFIWEVSEVKNKTLQIFRSRATKRNNTTPQTSTANGPSTPIANVPSTSMASGPSTSTANRHSPSTANGPSTSTANGPSTSTTNGPAIANGPSSSTANGPSSSMVNGPSTSTANVPSTPTANVPSTPTTNVPSWAMEPDNDGPDNDGPCRHSARRFRLFRRRVR